METVEKTAQMRLIELERGRPLDVLIEAGLDQGWTLAEVAQDLGVATPTMYDWCKLLGLKVVRRYSLVRKRELAGTAR